MYNDGQLGPATVLAPADGGSYHFYPSWSPDGKWPVFATAQVGGPTADDKSPANRTARLRLIEVASGRVYDLPAATQGPNSAYAPSWLPYQETTQDNHIAYWTEVISCDSTGRIDSAGCGEDEYCAFDGQCQPIVK